MSGDGSRAAVRLRGGLWWWLGGRVEGGVLGVEFYNFLHEFNGRPVLNVFELKAESRIIEGNIHFPQPPDSLKGVPGDSMGPLSWG